MGPVGAGWDSCGLSGPSGAGAEPRAKGEAGGRSDTHPLCVVLSHFLLPFVRVVEVPVALSPQPPRPQRRALPHGGGKGRLRQLLQAVPGRAAGAGRGPPAGRAARAGAGVRAGEGCAERLDWGHVCHVSPLPGKGCWHTVTAPAQGWWLALPEHATGQEEAGVGSGWPRPQHQAGGPAAALWQRQDAFSFQS